MREEAYPLYAKDRNVRHKPHGPGETFDRTFRRPSSVEGRNFRHCASDTSADNLGPSDAMAMTTTLIGSEQCRKAIQPAIRVRPGLKIMGARRGRVFLAK